MFMFLCMMHPKTWLSILTESPVATPSDSHRLPKVSPQLFTLMDEVHLATKKREGNTPKRKYP